jgi:pimeloyl-ACP methyl ester carboxylesterase
MGAGYTLRLAAEHPGRVLGAMLLGASIRMHGAPDSTAEARRHAEFEDELPSDEEVGEVQRPLLANAPTSTPGGAASA